MDLTILGTGNALVTECYNTCFVLSDKKQHFLVDGGGGSTILKHLKEANIRFNDIHDIFITHKHIDHILGLLWVIRGICQAMKQDTYPGEARIYGHLDVIRLLDEMARNLLNEKEIQFLGKRLFFIPVSDRESKWIIDHKVTFFDIHSTKTKQYGFSMWLDEEKKLTCCGDEPYNPVYRDLAEGSDWMLHEAFCLYSEAPIYKPYEKHHSTVREACEQANALHIKNLVLYHTEDDHILERKTLYLREGSTYFNGNLFIPDDLDVISLEK